MSQQSEALKERSMLFAVNILRLIDRFPRTVGGDVIAKQLARSATSVTANYRAACTARSRRDFIAKLAIVAEEADETVCWLELIVRARIVEATSCQLCAAKPMNSEPFFRGLLGRLAPIAASSQK